MSKNVSGFPNRGKTYHGPTRTIDSTFGADELAAEGSVQVFEDFAVPTSPGARVKRSNQQQKCVLVRNASGGNLSAGAAVGWKATYRGRRVDVVTGTANMEIAGFVDPFIGAAVVRANDLFWLVLKGRGAFLKATGALTEGDILACDAAGKLAAVGTPGTNTAAMQFALTAAGRAFADAGSSDATVDAYVDVSKWIE